MKNTTIVSVLLMMGLTAPLSAEPSSEVAFDAETRALLREASPENGQKLAKEHKCAKCHEESGIAEDPEDPNIAGQMASYAYKQMVDYQNGSRDNRSMKKALKKLDNAGMADLAVWFETLPAPESMKKHSDVAHNLIYNGDPKRMIKPCASCHGRSGQGGKHDSAMLMGQNRDYFVTTMTEFQDEDRTNDIYSRMRVIAVELTEEEIEALADYYGIPAPAE